MGVAIVHSEFSLFSKQEFRALADSLTEQDAIDRCAEFILVETKSIGQRRVRAMMCRRLKHCELNRASHIKLLACIPQSFQPGTLSEQFKDQLRLAIRLDSKQVSDTCVRAASGEFSHVRRNSEWALFQQAGNYNPQILDRVAS